MPIASKELRERAVAAYKTGAFTQQQLADAYRVHYKTIQNWLKADAKGEPQAPKPRGCRQRIFTKDEEVELLKIIRDEPSITLEKIKLKFHKTCNVSVVHRTLLKLGMTYKKKTLRASEQEREDIKHAREEWKQWALECAKGSLVFIDESSAKTNMCPLYGRSLRGKRCYGSAPGSWHTTTMLSSLRLNGDTECLVFDGAVDKKMFKAYMEDMLLPTLQTGDTVIMDNLSVHKNSFDTEKFASKCIRIKYLPAYSPDLNPIEKMWSKIKGILREYQATDADSLFNAIGEAFRSITPSNAQGWFKGCGYFQ
jgi:transposase